jgi:uncharacterized protein YndB with AHSA1/START domain
VKNEPHVKVRVIHRFRASPERVFDAWLDPEKAGKWLFATASGQMVRVDIDARIGAHLSSWIAEMARISSMSGNILR